MAPMPQVRVGDELFEAAREAGRERGTSAAEQVRSWLELGREFEQALGPVNFDVLDALFAARERSDSGQKMA